MEWRRLGVTRRALLALAAGATVVVGGCIGDESIPMHWEVVETRLEGGGIPRWAGGDQVWMDRGAAGGELLRLPSGAFRSGEVEGVLSLGPPDDPGVVQLTTAGPAGLVVTTWRAGVLESARAALSDPYDPALLRAATLRQVDPSGVTPAPPLVLGPTYLFTGDTPTPRIAAWYGVAGWHLRSIHSTWNRPCPEGQASADTLALLCGAPGQRIVMVYAVRGPAEGQAPLEAPVVPSLTLEAELAAELGEPTGLAVGDGVLAVVLDGARVQLFERRGEGRWEPGAAFAGTGADLRQGRLLIVHAEGGDLHARSGSGWTLGRRYRPEHGRHAWRGALISAGAVVLAHDGAAYAYATVLIPD